MAYARQSELRAPTSGGGIIAMGEMDWESSSIDGQDEEVLVTNEGSEEDQRFDSIVGALEEAVMDPAFAALQQSFVNRWCGEFHDMEENKLIYTDLFREYTQLVETHLDGWLRQCVKNFDMEAFMEMVTERQDEIVGDVIDILMAVGDFNEFKGMMLAHRKGRDNDLGSAVAAIGVGPQNEANRGLGGPSAMGHGLRQSGSLPEWAQSMEISSGSVGAGESKG